MPASPPLLWDLFCQVVDNHGDLGVCWRLARELAARGQQVRLWVDQPEALAWMAPGTLQGGVPGVRVLPWTQPFEPAALSDMPPADVWVEAFGCALPEAFVAQGARALAAGVPGGHQRAPVWINLEYLSAEAWVERQHGLPSPVQHGPARGWVKWFFYPGFTPRTGGLLREADLDARQARFDRAAWLRAQGIAWRGERLVSLFCYEPAALGALLQQLAATDQSSQLLVTAGRATQAMRHALQNATLPPLPLAGEGWGEGQGLSFEEGRTTGAMRPPPSPCPLPPVGGEVKRASRALRLTQLPYLPQTGYDELLWACDLNFVRGEDSLARALWAGAPFVWQIYPQHDDAHHAKLAVFLDWLDAPASLRRFHRVWNGIKGGALPAIDLPGWRACAQAARARLLAQPELGAALIDFALEKR